MQANREQQFAEALEALLPGLASGEAKAVRSARRLLGVLADRGPVSVRDDATRVAHGPDKTLRDGVDAIARALQSRNSASAAAPILIIEDDDLVSAAIGVHLAPLGREILEARDLSTARRMLAQRAPAAVILDLQLRQGEDGRDLLVDHSVDTVFVVLSAMADDPAVRRECRALGARATLAKPVVAAPLLEALQTLLTRASSFHAPDNAHVLSLLRHRTHLTDEDMAACAAGITDLTWEAAVRGHMDACDECREAYRRLLRETA
ncbi:MAG: response regulator [Proteobacteria bacterium]|nr:response regulator [Pseudomonadota bacterium]